MLKFIRDRVGMVLLASQLAPGVTARYFNTVVGMRQKSCPQSVWDRDVLLFSNLSK